MAFLRANLTGVEDDLKVDLRIKKSYFLFWLEGYTGEYIYISIFYGFFVSHCLFVSFWLNWINICLIRCLLKLWKQSKSFFFFFRVIWILWQGQLNQICQYINPQKKIGKAGLSGEVRKICSRKGTVSFLLFCLGLIRKGW